MAKLEYQRFIEFAPLAVINFKKRDSVTESGW